MNTRARTHTQFLNKQIHITFTHLSKVRVCVPEARALPPASQTSQQRTHVPICAPQMSGCAPEQRHRSLTESISVSPSNRYLLTAPTLMPADPHSAGVLPSLPDALTCAAIQADAQAAQAPGVVGSKSSVRKWLRLTATAGSLSY